MRRQFSSLILPGAFLFLQILLFQAPGVLSIAVNRSIDDTLGDSETGQRPVFLPASGVWEDNTCTGCALKPPASQAFNGTYKAATYNAGLKNMSISFDFFGTAIYVFFILANNPASGITATTAANFTLNGNLAGNFQHQPNSSAPDFQFNQSALAFSQTNLKNTSHSMLITTSGPDDIYVNFDYALYTSLNGVPASSTTTPGKTGANATPTSTRSPSKPSASSSSPTGAIVGGVVGGVVLLAALVAGIFFCRRRREHQLLDSPDDHEAGHSHNPVSQLAVDPFVLPTEGSSSASVPEHSRLHSDALSKSRLAQPNTANRSECASTSQLLTDTDTDEYTRRHSQYTDTSLGTTVISGPHYQNRSVVSTLPSGQLVLSPGSKRDQFPASALPSSTLFPNTSRIPDTPVTAVTPVPDSKAELRLMRQRELERQMRQIKGEIQDLQEEAAQRNTAAPATATARRKKSVKGQDVTEDVSQLKAQIQTMSEQIAFLQTQQQSAWAQGLSDEPPPGYTPRLPG